MNWHKLYIPAVVVLLLGVCYGVYAYIGEHERSVRAEEQKKASDAIIALKDKAMADRDKQFQDYKNQIDMQIANIKTGKQATTVLQPILMPNGGQAPPTITKADLPPSVQPSVQGTPDSKLTIFTEQQTIDLAKFKLECDKTTSGLTVCQKDKSDLQAKFDAKVIESQKWEEAAKGGTKVHRFLGVVVPSACGGGGAWVGSNKGSKGAAIGAVVGFVVCKLAIR